MEKDMNDKEFANAVVAILGFEVSDMYDKPLLAQDRVQRATF